MNSFARRLLRNSSLGLVAFFTFPIHPLFAGEFSVTEYHRYESENRLAACKEYSGKVERVIADEPGATIRFRVNKVTNWRRQRDAVEAPPQADAESYELPDLSTEAPVKAWAWSRDVAQTLNFHWVKADGPVPVAAGMTSTMTADGKGNLVDISYVAAITHWRKGKDGLVEVVLGCETEGKPARPALLYVRPARMAAAACGMNIHWTRKWGLLITVDWAGPESVEAEAPASSRPALILANAPEMQIVPGREGWQALPSLKTYDEMGGGKDPKSEAAAAKAWKKIERAIPKKQYMQTAG